MKRVFCQIWALLRGLKAALWQGVTLLLAFASSLLILPRARPTTRPPEPPVESTRAFSELRGAIADLSRAAQDIADKNAGAR